MSSVRVEPDIVQIDDDSFYFNLASSEMAAFNIYMLAHKLMPFDFDLLRYPQEVDRSSAALNDPLATETELLRAIAILGHSPCQEALHALDIFAKSGHRFASVARLALSECRGMAQLPANRQSAVTLSTQRVARA
ncbi:MAG: hypothetical protein JXA30_05295 [Deltaproteobacteria bacterium]|nr:hypothetical protein [Deltaproteobacteria bacterium]